YIPGTHDSGTYGIYDRIKARWARTQNLDIYEQLLNGIRYLDIRLETNDDKKIYISHGYIDSINKKTGKKYYLSDIIDECVMFLKNNDKEFIVLNLADENFDKDFSWDY
ncbi:PLC-like phosphodiesterase, partial [Neocallimastix lanati (nom. inval.)]